MKFKILEKRRVVSDWEFVWEVEASSIEEAIEKCESNLYDNEIMELDSNRICSDTQDAEFSEYDEEKGD